jgi:hypothetical protein
VLDATTGGGTVDELIELDDEAENDDEPEAAETVSFWGHFVEFICALLAGVPG